jgi:hypothetical protein
LTWRSAHVVNVGDVSGLSVSLKKQEPYAHPAVWEALVAVTGMGVQIVSVYYEILHRLRVDDERV